MICLLVISVFSTCIFFIVYSPAQLYCLLIKLYLLVYPLLSLFTFTSLHLFLSVFLYLSVCFLVCFYLFVFLLTPHLPACLSSPVFIYVYFSVYLIHPCYIFSFTSLFLYLYLCTFMPLLALIDRYCFYICTAIGATVEHKERGA